MTPNYPVAGSIGWAGFNIQYNGVSYAIGAGYTDQRWVWWRYNSGGATTVIEAGMDVPEGVLVNQILNGEFDKDHPTDITFAADWLRPTTGTLWYNAAHTIAVSSAQIFSGYQSMALTTGIAGATGPSVQQSVTLVPGSTMRLTFIAKGNVAMTGGLYAMLVNSGGTAEIIRFANIQSAAVSTSWMAYSGTVVVPAGATAGRLLILSYGRNVGDVVYVENVELGILPNPVGLNDDDLVLFGNKNGIPFRVQSSSFIDGDLLIDGSVAVEALVADVIVVDDIYTQNAFLGKVKADQIEAGEGLLTELTVQGGLKMNVSALVPNGTMRLNPRDGLVVDHPDGRQSYIKADGTGSQFIGDAILDNLTLNGEMNLAGLNMKLSGELRAMDGITAPSVPLSVASTYPVNTYHADQWWDGTGPTRDKTTAYFRGLCDDYAGGAYIAGRRGVFGTPYADIVWGNKNDSAGFIEEALPSGWAPVGGVTRMGTTYYTLSCAMNMTTAVLNYAVWRVHKIAAGGTVTGSFDVSHAGASNRLPAIGNDGTNLLILLSTTSNSIYLRTCLPTFTGTLGGTGQFLLGTAGIWTGSTPTGIIRTFANGPTGLDRYYVSSENGISYSHTTAGTRMNAENFPLAAGDSRGMFIDSIDGRIRSLHSDGRIYSYTWLSGSWDLGHSWYGTDRPLVPGPGTSGVAETPVKRITVTPARFATWVVSISQKPPGTNADPLSANAARIYAGPVGVGLMTLQDTLLDGVLSKTYTVPWPVTVEPEKTANGFASRPGGLGIVESFELNPAGTAPVWQLTGAGPGNLGSALSWDATGKSTVPMAGYRSTSTDQSLLNATFTSVLFGGTPDHQVGGITIATNTVVTVPVAGIYVIFAHVNWATNAVGRRIIQLMRWASAAAVPALGTNTNAIGRSEISPNSYATNDMTVQVSCAAGDKLRLDAYQSSTISLAIDNSYGGSQFNVLKIG